MYQSKEEQWAPGSCKLSHLAVAFFASAAEQNKQAQSLQGHFCLGTCDSAFGALP